MHSTSLRIGDSEPRKAVIAKCFLDLFTITEGETYGLYGHPLKADVFADDSYIRRCLNMPVWYLNRTLAYRIKLETNEQQGRLKQILQTAEAE